MTVPHDDRVERWRRDTPGVSERVHLNNAGAALMPRPVLDAMRDHLDREAQIGGYEASDEAADAVRDGYAAVGALVGAAAANIAVTENATVAFAQAMSAFDFAQGDVIVTTRNDYISNQLFFLSLARRRGVEVLRAHDLPAGGVDPTSVAALARLPRCRLVSVTWIPTNSGLVQPVEAVGDICERVGVPYLIDACQAVGQIPIDVSRLKCDYLSATARKFLRGPRGVGFLYVSGRALARGDVPLYVDMRGAEWTQADRFAPAPDARRFENWEFAYTLVLGLGAAAAYALTQKVAVAGERARQLAAYARERLSAIPGVRILDRGTELSAIVSAEVAGCDGGDVVRRLREQGINTSVIERGFAVIDMDEKRAASGVRVSPHYYNTTDDVDAAVDAITAISGG
ncbi:MAG TPA: aminotransferase class V-fold PLP-dependent enzyme [Gemmatimonadales bacterium]